MDKLSIEARLKAEVISFSGKVSIYANDFKGNVIDIDASEKYEAGSCVKVFILAEFYRQVKCGLIDPDEILTYKEENYISGSGIIRSLGVGLKMKAKDFATLMIIVSDNIATNTLIDFLGIDNINNTCKDLGFKDTILHNKINFEKYEKLATTTPKDYGYYFEKLYREELWNKEISREMLSIFKNQHYNTIITKDFPQYYLDSEDTGDDELIFVASKSGSMDSSRNDGGLIYTPYGSYLLAIFTKNFKDPLYYSEHEAYRFGPKASRLLFDQYLALKGSFK